MLNKELFLVKLILALRFDKSQSWLLNIVKVDLRCSVLTHELLYIALSRVTSVQGVTILMKSDIKEKLKESYL
jgi:hypothetical protein